MPLDSYIKIETFLKINKAKTNKTKSIDNILDDLNDILSNKRNSTTIDMNNNNESNERVRIEKKKNIFKSYNKKSKNNNIIHFTIKQHIIKISNFTRFKSKVKNEKEIKKVICSK